MPCRFGGAWGDCNSDGRLNLVVTGLFGTIEWDGTTANGNAAVSGIYFYRVETAEGSAQGQIRIVRYARRFDQDDNDRASAPDVCGGPSFFRRYRFRPLLKRFSLGYTSSHSYTRAQAERPGVSYRIRYCG